jgi:hypothetical protein
MKYFCEGEEHRVVNTTLRQDEIYSCRDLNCKAVHSPGESQRTNEAVNSGHGQVS